MYALLLPSLVGIVGLGVESGVWYMSKRVLQTQADAAARSGAFERAKGHPDYTVVSAAAENEATRNGFVNTAPNTLVINNPPASGDHTGEDSAVEVELGTTQAVFLSALFLNDVSLKARAVAAVEVTGTACVLALDPSSSGAIQNQGNPTIAMDGCVLASNSTSSSAIAISGSTDLTADSLWTAGNITIGGSSTVSLGSDPTVNAWPIDDPYEDVAIPPLGACDQDNLVLTNVTTTLDPGVYCDGLTFGSNAVVTLNPGTYYVNKGDIDIAATAVVRCSCPNPEDGVTIVLTSDVGPGSIGTVTIAGGADVQLRAPTDPLDPFTGILFYQDRSAPPGPTMKFTGGSNMLLTGAIYVPQQVIQWSGGNGASGSTCTQIVGRQVVFIGNSQIVNTGCDAAGIQPLQILGVRVVE